METQSSELNTIGAPRRSLQSVNLLLDGRKLGDGGIGVYIENLIKGLLEIGSGRVSVLTHPDKITREKFGKDVTWILDKARPYSLDEMLMMPRRIRFDTYDVFHSPHYTLPFGIPVPKVVTIHDLIHISHPEKAYYPFLAKRLISSAVARADKVISVSQDTRRQLISTFKLNPDKIVWVPNAAGSQSSETTPPRTGLQKKLCELKPYVLAVFSNIKPHKGFSDLIAAFQIAKERMQQNSTQIYVNATSTASVKGLKLVLVGQGTEELLNDDAALKLISHSDAIHVLGKVSDEDLTQLYSGARCVAVASKAEGFCLPALEAQKQGTRVAARPVPAISEVLSSNDSIAKDFSIESFAEAICEVSVRSPMTTEESYRNSERLEKYSISHTAQQILSVYQSVTSAEYLSKGKI